MTTRKHLLPQLKPSRFSTASCSSTAHAGVIEPRQLYGAENPVPWVLSKLNEATGEVLHPIEDVHAAFEYDTQIWTDRYQGHHAN